VVNIDLGLMFHHPTLIDLVKLFPGMLMRPAKCEAEAKAEVRYHKAEAEVEAKAKRLRGRRRTL